MNPSVPQFVNTDGHALNFQKLIFEINSAEEAFNVLYKLCPMETKKEQFEHATKEKDGTVIQAQISWLNKEKKVLGKININGTRMEVEVNSEERKETFLKTLDSKFSGKWKLKNILFINHTIPSHSEPFQENTNDPVAEEAIKAVTRSHWESWPDMKLPALGNKTPREALKTKKGRELVEAILSGIKDLDREILEKLNKD